MEGCPERDDPPNPVDTAYHSALPTQDLNEVFSFTYDLVMNDPAEPEFSFFNFYSCVLTMAMLL